MNKGRFRYGRAIGGLAVIMVIFAIIPHAQAISGLAFLGIIGLGIHGLFSRRAIASPQYPRYPEIPYNPQILNSPEPEPLVANPEPPGQYNSRYIPRDVQIKVSQRDNARCRKCGSPDDLQFDHIIPWSRGGANTVDNIQLLCGSCNRTKSNG